MTSRPAKLQQGFTLVELMVGSILSLLILGAVLTCYIFLARNFVRTIGISNASQPTLAAQGRRSMILFEQDAREAVAIKSGSSASSIILYVLSTGDTGNTSNIVVLSYVTYTYNSAAGTLTRTFTSGTPAYPAPHHP
ncbi:MAG: PilW family protein, partial [Opitutales bacterium]